MFGFNELEEMRNDAYLNSKIAKERLKKWHDQLVNQKNFAKGQRDLLYDSKLHLFPGKLKSRWTGPFIIHEVQPNGVVELLNFNSTRTFKEGLKNEVLVKKGKTGEKRQDSAKQFRTPLTLCEFAFAPLFKNCMLSVPCANFTGMRTLCEPCANSFFAPIFKTMLSVLENHSSPEQSESRPCGAPLDAPSHLPDSAPQSRYHTRRASATSVAPPQIPPRILLQRKPRLQSQESPPEHLGIHSLSLLPPGALDPACPLRATPIADRETFMSRHISITLLCDSSLSCGIHTAYLRASILFTIDGRQGILGARQIVDAFHIPFAPADPATFRLWAPLSEWDMVRILSRGTSSQRTILRRELPPEMLLVDVVLRANLFPLQHKVQRRGAIMEALFRISEGYYFGPHHLIMAALLHFEEKDPRSEPRRHCRESFSLDQWTQIWLHRQSPELPEPREVPPAPSTSDPSQPVPEAASSDAPPVVPPTSEPPITIPGPEYRALLASFQTLTTTQTTIMERMDHFQLQ
ncbi:hypothetical protein CK203_027294 [Vitis vinifera]|uniref:Uncharacterized protein n=1 Tax=Vitis vinifera TaxID=29760 RepID=A0A438J9P7_VITVI|nr:hypothetical protein CK203_027294 [Vitis vinifera]